jgi:hypothetical protein
MGELAANDVWSYYPRRFTVRQNHDMTIRVNSRVTQNTAERFSLEG